MTAFAAVTGSGPFRTASGRYSFQTPIFMLRRERNMNTKARRITTLAMLCALAYVMTAVGRIPVVLFLKYDPKDAVIALAGMIWGPLTACAVCVVTAVMEMLSLSETGIIGCMMNIVSSCSFACTAAVLYQRRPARSGAAAALTAGSLVMTAMMLLWNYLVTPLYLGYPRQAVAGLLLPVFLPFNLLKGGLNAGIAFLFYRPVTAALRKSGLAGGRP